MCGEWEFGGLPSWLIEQTPNMKVLHSGCGLGLVRRSGQGGPTGGGQEGPWQFLVLFSSKYTYV